MSFFTFKEELSDKEYLIGDFHNGNILIKAFNNKYGDGIVQFYNSEVMPIGKLDKVPDNISEKPEVVFIFRNKESLESVIGVLNELK